MRFARHKSPRNKKNKILAWALLLGLGAIIVHEALAWPKVAALAKQNPRTTAFIERYQERERRAGRRPAVSWQWVPYARVSASLKRAALVSEDIDFFSHHGFELPEIRSAIQEAVEEGEMPRGASTITQQVAKNLWLSPSRNPLRKLKEAILTLELEHYLTKKRILEIYLNVAEFGPGVYGAEAAARHYFNKAADQLSETEAAGLAAGLPKPGSWHPGSKSRAYAKRVTIILERMNKSDFLWKRL